MICLCMQSIPNWLCQILAARRISMESTLIWRNVRDGFWDRRTSQVHDSMKPSTIRYLFSYVNVVTVSNLYTSTIRKLSLIENRGPTNCISSWHPNPSLDWVTFWSRFFACIWVMTVAFLGLKIKIPTCILCPHWGWPHWNFTDNLWYQNTGVHGLSCGIVYVILCLAILRQ